MKYLANENIPLGTIESPRIEGVDILSIKSFSPGAMDEEVIKISINEDRILVTFDKDFGELAFRRGIFNPKGIILLRIEPKSEAQITGELRGLLNEKIDFKGHFTIVAKGRIRVVPLP